MQLELFDPCWQFGEPRQTVVANAGRAVADGMALELDFLVTDHLNLGLVSTKLFNSEIDTGCQWRIMRRYSR